VAPFRQADLPEEARDTETVVRVTVDGAPEVDAHDALPLRAIPPFPGNEVWMGEEKVQNIRVHGMEPRRP